MPLKWVEGQLSLIKKKEAQRPERSPEYQRLSTDFLSEGLTFVYQNSHHKLNDINHGMVKQHHNKCAVY